MAREMKVLRPLLFTNVTCDLVAHTADLSHWLTNMNQIPDLLANQHPIRIWEYAMTMRNIFAYTTTIADRRTARDGFRVADIGSSSSNFWKLLAKYIVRTDKVHCIDPLYRVGQQAEEGQYLIAADAETAALSYVNAFDIITCVSVIEHIHPAFLPAFFSACTTMLRPNGLLCFTCDFGDYQRHDPSKDQYHFHWMREQIFDQASIVKLLDDCGRLGYNLLGASDFSWKGPQVFDYTMASAALVYQPSGEESPE